VTQTGILINGEPTSDNRVDMTALGNAFHPAAGAPTDIFHVVLSYNYATKTLTETVVDTGSTQPGGTGTTTYTNSYTVDVPAVLGTTNAYVGFTGATGGANSVQDILNWRFTKAPVATNNQFLYQSGPRSISMSFDQDVSASLTASDLLVHNITTNTDISTGVLSYDHATNVATWTFSALTNGNYHASLAAGSVSNSSLNLLTAATSLDFFWLNGDTNHDRSVNFADLVAVAQHYGQNSGAVLATGDLDGDGKVGFVDLVAVAQNYGTTLAALPGATPGALPSGAVLSPTEQAAVLAALPPSAAKTLALQLIGSSSTPTTPAKPAPVASKPAPVTTISKLAATTTTSKPASLKAASKPVVIAVAKPVVTSFSTMRITTANKNKEVLL